MNKRTLSAVIMIILAFAATAHAQSPKPEVWIPAGRAAEAFTGNVTFTPNRITFAGGKSLALTPADIISFTNDMGKRVDANIYKVDKPEDPALVGGNKLCGGKKVAYFLVWHADNMIQMNAFSGPSFVSGSPADCGRFGYDPG
jgi:hypothetical protein